MNYPQLTSIQVTKLWTENFLGLDRRPRVSAGAFQAMGNMTGEPWPLLCSRKKRGLVAELERPLGIYAMEKLAWIDGRTLYYGGQATPINTLSLEENMLPKRMVSMGAYLLIFPDGYYYNTANALDYGSVNRLYLSPAGGSVSFTLCDQEGTPYAAGASDTEPQNPAEGQYWIDTSGDVSVLNVYGGEWTQVPSVYVKISAPGIGAGLSPLDGVTLSGISGGATARIQEQLALLNNTVTVTAAGDDWIVTAGILDENVTQTGGSVRADRKIPEMDFVIECNNRLWGCRHGEQNGETVNQIYACALGDFKNWQKFTGTSQDSYYVDVGSDGPFTGAVNHKGRPYFFKEKICHMIYGDRPSNWSMQASEIEGPQEGSSGTIAGWNGALFYLSRHGVQMFDGMAQEMSQALGKKKLLGGAAGVCDNVYYLSVEEQNGSSLYTLDCGRGAWHRQDGSAAVGFSTLKGEIYMLCQNGLLFALNGQDGTIESQDVEWFAETAEMGYEYQNFKYLRRFILRMELSPGAECRMLIQYDGDGIWHDKGVLQGRRGVKTYLAPIVPRRCEHARLRLEGHGGMRLYGLGRELAVGSDGR